MTTTTHISRIGTVIVPVSDHDASIAFYTEKLGFEKRSDVAYGDTNRWVEIAPPGVETVIALADAGPGAPAGSVNNLGLATDDVDATYAELKSRGVDVDDEISRFPDPVPPMFWLRDPDGNRLIVAQRAD